MDKKSKKLGIADDFINLKALYYEDYPEKRIITIEGVPYCYEFFKYFVR